jgi:hypothetical protein
LIIKLPSLTAKNGKLSPQSKYEIRTHTLVLRQLRLYDSQADCRQFHQRFTREFFVQNFGAKNYKAETVSASVKCSLCNFLAPKYQRKICAKNVDEIDTWCPRPVCLPGKNGDRFQNLFQE